MQTQLESSESPPAPSHWRPKAKVFVVIRLLGGRSGGAERLFCDLVNMLADDGYDVTALYCDSSKRPPLFPLSPKVTRLNLWGRSARRALHYRALDLLGKQYDQSADPAPLNNILAPFDWLSKNLYFIRRLHAVMAQGKPDVVISFLPPANTPSLLASWRTSAKVIPTNHNVPEQDYRSELRWDQNPLDRWLRLWSLKAAARVHVLFPTFGEWFPQSVRDKIVVISNCVSPEFNSLPRDGERRREIIAAGRLAPVKNYMALVEAWGLLADKHSDWVVKIYGVGPQKNKLAARIAELNLGHVVKLMGHCGDMKTAYMEGQILCHPALHEGFGLSVAEALTCGLAVVAFSDCPGVNEFVFDRDNGLMVDRELGAEGLAAALDELICNDELRAEIQGRAPVSVEKFSQEAFRTRWAEVIDTVCAQQEAAGDGR